jgi:hypothetical protein
MWCGFRPAFPCRVSLSGDMGKTKDHNRVYEQIAELREERAALLPIVDALPEVKRLKALDAAISGLEQYAEATRQRTGAKTVSAPVESEFARLSLPRAAVKHLEQIGTPQTPEQIWDVLSAAGLTVMAKKPVHAVHKALSTYKITRGRRIKCADCAHHYSATSGTIFAHPKMTYRDLLMGLCLFANAVKGVSSLQFARNMAAMPKPLS